MRRLVTAIAALLALSWASCANPCEELAEVACQAAGEQSAECTKAREKAEKASSRDREQCNVAVRLVKSLERVR